MKTLLFSKPTESDWTREENQDRITENVWLTRANNMGIFNIKQESNYNYSYSPNDTEWAFGTTNNIGVLTFDNWEDTINSRPPNSLNQDMVLHLTTDDIYIDIKFTSWGISSSGGGFSYERSTNNFLNLDDFQSGNNIIIFPNPAKNSITILV